MNTAISICACNMAIHYDYVEENDRSTILCCKVRDKGVVGRLQAQCAKVQCIGDRRPTIAERLA